MRLIRLDFLAFFKPEAVAGGISGAACLARADRRESHGNRRRGHASARPGPRNVRRWLFMAGDHLAILAHAGPGRGCQRAGQQDFFGLQPGPSMPILLFISQVTRGALETDAGGLRARTRGADLGSPKSDRLGARIPHQVARELEMKSLSSNKVGEIDVFTRCFTPRSFGADTPRAALGTFLPAILKLKAMSGGPETHPEPPGTRHHPKAW